MDVWNYRGEGSWSFVALKRPGDERLFSVRNNTTSKITYTRQSYRKKDGVWVPGKPATEDFILNPGDKPRAVPVIDIPTVQERDKAIQQIFNPWYVLYLPGPGQATDDARAALVSQLLDLATEGALLFRKVSDQLTTTKDETIILGIAVANINDATCMSSILETDYYDTSREANAA